MTKKELYIQNSLNNGLKCYKCVICEKYPETFIEINGNQENFYMCKYCFLNVRDDNFDEIKELIHYCYRELDNWMDMVEDWEEELFDGKNAKLDINEDEVDIVINKLQELKKLIKGDK